MKKIDLNCNNRLESIRQMATKMQDTKMKKVSEFRRYAESIEILSNADLLKKLNKGLEDVSKGRTYSFDEMMVRIRKKRAVKATPSAPKEKVK